MREPRGIKMNKKSIFIRFLGESPRVKVLDFFLENYLFEYPKSTITQATGLTNEVVTNILKKFLDFGLIKRGTNQEKDTTFSLNKQNLIVKQLIKLEESLLGYWNTKQG